MRPAAVVLTVAVVGLQAIASAQNGQAQKGDLTHEHPATENAWVDFGKLATAPLGPSPCIQNLNPQQGAVAGGPTDPCQFATHRLVPEEVTISKDGEVTFQIHGGGHAIALYEVSKDTTRDEIGQMLCPGDDPSGIPVPVTNPAEHTCNAPLEGALETNQNLRHVVTDGHGDVVIVADNVTGLPNEHPNNRVWYTPGRLMLAGGVQFMNGGTTTPGTGPTGGQLVTYQFLKTGRYLVICANRTHLLNDWMFGFVNVVGE